MNDRSQGASPARLFVLAAGAALVIGGVAGFFYEHGFGTGGAFVSDDIIGVFPTNGWDNVLHLLAGFACLSFGGREPRTVAMALGLLLTLFALWGIVETERGVGTLLDAIPVSTADNLLHLFLGLAGVGAALLSAPDRSPAPG